MWATFNDTYAAIIERAIKRYEELYPGYSVKYTKYSGGYSDLAAACVKGFAANNYPDIAVVYPDSVADFLMAGRSVNMEKYVNDPTYGWTEDDFEDIHEEYIEEATNYFVKGMYSLPLCKSTEALYYNRNIINVDLSLYDDTINDGEPLTDEYIDSLTWEEFFDHLCPALMQYNNEHNHSLWKIDGTYKDKWAILGYDSDDNLFITLAEQYGYGYTSLDKASGIGSVDFVNDGMKNLMKKFNDACKKRYITTQGIAATYSNYMSTTGQMPFTIGSTGGVSYQFSTDTNYDVGVAHIPHAEGRDYRVINQGPSFTVLKRPKDAASYAEQCWKFYQVLTSAEFSYDWAVGSGYSPIRYSVAESAEYLTYKDEEQHDLNSLDRLTARNATYVDSVFASLFSSPVFYGSSKARDAVKGLMADCLRAEDINASVDDLFDAAYNNAI